MEQKIEEKVHMKNWRGKIRPTSFSKINKQFTFTLQQKYFGEYSKIRLHKELSPILIPATKKHRYEERVGLLEKWHFLIFLSAVVIFLVFGD